MKFFEQNSTIIFTNHEIVLKIIKQINMIIVFIDKLNLRFVKTFDYIQRFDVELRHKSNKQHIVFDALSRFVNFNNDISFSKNELNAFLSLF